MSNRDDNDMIREMQRKRMRTYEARTTPFHLELRFDPETHCIRLYKVMKNKRDGSEVSNLFNQLVTSEIKTAKEAKDHDT